MAKAPTSGEKKTSKKKVAKKASAKKVTKKKVAAKKTTAAGIDSKVRYQMISKIAYRRAEQRGFAPGNEQGDWFWAEQLTDELITIINK